MQEKRSFLLTLTLPYIKTFIIRLARCKIANQVLSRENLTTLCIKSGHFFFFTIHSLSQSPTQSAHDQLNKWNGWQMEDVVHCIFSCCFTWIRLYYGRKSADISRIIEPNSLYWLSLHLQTNAVNCHQDESKLNYIWLRLEQRWIAPVSLPHEFIIMILKFNNDVNVIDNTINISSINWNWI